MTPHSELPSAERIAEYVDGARKVLSDPLPAEHKLWKSWALDLADNVLALARKLDGTQEQLEACEADRNSLSKSADYLQEQLEALEAERDRLREGVNDAADILDVIGKWFSAGADAENMSPILDHALPMMEKWEAKLAAVSFPASDPEAKLWESTLMDGLEDDPYPASAPGVTPSPDQTEDGAVSVTPASPGAGESSPATQLGSSAPRSNSEGGSVGASNPASEPKP